MEMSTEHFRNVLKLETDKLNDLSEKWSHEMTRDSIPDDAIGQIRSVIGQAKLLMCQRFKQFNCLIDDCEFKRGEKETKIEDLLGFWDMIYFQIEDVHRKFTALDALKDNKWIEIVPNVVPQRKKKLFKPKQETQVNGHKSLPKGSVSKSIRTHSEVTKDNGGNDCVKEKENVKSVESSVGKKSPQKAPIMCKSPMKRTPLARSIKK